MPTDASDMKSMILRFPEQFVQGCDAAGATGSTFADFNPAVLVLAGMGGSALPGNLLRTFAKELNLTLPITVHRDYGLPGGFPADNALVIVLSYSGNTEEALSSYEEARKRGMPLAVITTENSGKLQEYAERDNVPMALIPKQAENFQPRIGIGLQAAALMAILANAGIIESQQALMEELSQTLDPKAAEQIAQPLVDAIAGTTPLLYSSTKYGAIAHIMKIQLNENAKMHAFANTLPELNHNEMVGYEGSDLSRFSTIMLRAEDDNLRVQRRQELTGNLIEEHGGKVYTIDISGNNVYHKVFQTILVGNWLSYYLALKRDIDPTPVVIVEDFKKKLSS